MRFVLPSLACAVVSLATRSSLAQAPDQRADGPAPSADVAPAPTAAPIPPASPAPAAAPPAVQALVAARSVCLIGAHPGVAPDSAATTVGIVCDELRRLGAPVAGAYEQPGDAASAYRVELQRLDRLVILRVTFESPIGTPRDSRAATMGGLDEVLVAGKRVAKALVSGEPLDDTAEVDTLLAGESRMYNKKPGEMFYGIGLAGYVTPGVGGDIAPGFIFDVFYETPAFAVGAGLRGSTMSKGQDAKATSIGTISVGGRGFLTRGDFAPYVGGGVAYSGMEVDDGDFYGDSGGFGAYAEAGIEMLRFYKTRLLVGARVELPFYSVKEDQGDWWGGPLASSSAPPVAKDRSRYIMPISLAATFAF